MPITIDLSVKQRLAGHDNIMSLGANATSSLYRSRSRTPLASLSTGRSLVSVSRTLLQSWLLDFLRTPKE